MTMFAKIVDVLSEMDVEGAEPEKQLGDDLQMDSQELVCATVDFERIFSVKLADGELTRDMTVGDLAILLARKTAQQAAIGDFDYALCEDTTIRAPLEAVYEALHDAAAWPQKLPHVLGIAMHYDDGRYQEFDMEIDGGAGGRIAVRSVRRCEPGRIRFFQPSPPAFLRHHCGEWILQPLDGDLTLLSTRHEWRLSDAAARLFPSLDGIATPERVRGWLTEHARVALERWKNNLESGATP